MMADLLIGGEGQLDRIDVWRWPNKYTHTDLTCVISLDNLFSVHYFEYASNFVFDGESHDFWEFVFVDKGEIEITAGERKCILRKGDIYFHKPNEFHGLRASGLTAPNLVVASFGCQSPAMSFFEDRLLKISAAERDLLACVVKEAHDAYSSPLYDPAIFKLEKRAECPFGAEQIIKLSLEHMLIRLIRANTQPPQTKPQIPKATSSIKEHSTSEVIRRIIEYLEAHVDTTLSLDDICRDNLIGRSYLQKLFRETYGSGVIEYFGELKIQAAKLAIRHGERNFTEIAHDLGFASIHYFSRRFKKITGMTPSEYASSVKVRSESVKPLP